MSDPVAYRLVSDEKPHGIMFVRTEEQAKHTLNNILAYVKKGIYTNPRYEPLYLAPQPQKGE